MDATWGLQLELQAGNDEMHNKQRVTGVTLRSSSRREGGARELASEQP